jgi:hypothetical protein
VQFNVSDDLRIKVNRFVKCNVTEVIHIILKYATLTRDEQIGLHCQLPVVIKSVEMNCQHIHPETVIYIYTTDTHFTLPVI